MVGFKFNDGGRSLAGFKGTTGDCVTRALSIFLGKGQPDGDLYKRVYKVMAAANKATRGEKTARKGIYKKDYDRIFQEHGLTKVRVPRGTKPTYTEVWEKYGNCIVKTTKHVSAIIDGDLHDIWDGRQYVLMTHPDVSFAGEVRERKATTIWV